MPTAPAFNRLDRPARAKAKSSVHDTVVVELEPAKQPEKQFPHGPSSFAERRADKAGGRIGRQRSSTVTADQG